MGAVVVGIGVMRMKSLSWRERVFADRGSEKSREWATEKRSNKRRGVVLRWWWSQYARWEEESTCAVSFGCALRATRAGIGITW